MRHGRIGAKQATSKRKSLDITNATIDFIKSWEGFSATAYYDVSRWSVGYGTVGYEGEVVTEEEAAKRLQEVVATYADRLSRKLTFEPTPSQTTGLLSAAYNLGVGGISKITIACNSGEFRDAARMLRLYDHAGGKQLAALTRRREAEAGLLWQPGPVVVDNEMNRGNPRTQYARVVHLVEQNISIDKWVQVAKEAYEARSSVTASYDDAGIGDLDDRTVILHGQHPGAEEWFEEHYPGVKIVRDNSPAPIAPRPDIEQTKHTLWGLHGSADACWGHTSEAVPSILEMAKTARIQAFKVLSTENPHTVEVMQKINPNMFFMVRAMWQPDEHNCTTDAFLNATLDHCRAWYDQGVRFFELHNEPNLFIEGLGLCWANGAEFAQLFLNAARVFRRKMPEIQIGWPGLSPGPDVPRIRAAALPFYKEAEDAGALQEADWIGAHCYFQTDLESMLKDGGQYYRNYIRGNKPILITEFSNPSPGVDKAEKAHTYVDYVKSLDSIVHSCYSFIATASSSFPHETWADSPIAQIVGARSCGTTNT